MNIKQNDPKLKKEIQKFGCYLLCLHYYISKIKTLEFTIFDINNNYNKFVNLGYIKSNGFILNPCKIFNHYGINADVRWEYKNYVSKSNEFEVSEVEIDRISGSHFIATNNSIVLYDSLKLKEKGTPYHTLSKRIFRKH
ncbi:DUF261 family protein (plasmid) [Borrelia miyamotoi]|uniref:DUF261 family protein n=2 Tax=Borrelia miyamotoi TaxID=47466 RepID=A0AAQ3CMC9_9SPIR|nr:DUF261 family protein [Borrelia miyamotoi]AHH05713.1 Hypothetical protein BOM_1170 [Borrelia miyamotoi FR64b]ATQ15317.1 DUF261 family protein [Borrelia miyamotoi]ATQ16500.1 DUF261 family protein [Borrelia miyamotoi]ATQ17647.1 DUF261 family protein [Borrelia miyamotoi]ATQ18902.1 DUF261 family protein [Borrelia miyamotoi]